MELHLHQFRSTTKFTLSKLHDEQFNTICFVLEPGQNDPAKGYKGRIPRGRYEIVPNDWGFWQKKLVGLFGYARHRLGVPMLRNVPGFTAILIHPGNTTKDTEGCLLPGISIGDGGSFVKDSRTAYMRLYEKYIRAAWERRETVYITLH